MKDNANKSRDWELIRVFISTSLAMLAMTFFLHAVANGKMEIISRLL